jgi:hypothetical protein
LRSALIAGIRFFMPEIKPGKSDLGWKNYILVQNQRLTQSSAIWALGLHQ